MVTKVQIPKGLLVGLAGVAAAAVLGIVFLLGRESGRSAFGSRQKEPIGTGTSVGSADPPSKTAGPVSPVSQPAAESPILAPIPITGTAGAAHPEAPQGPAAVPSALTLLHDDPGRITVAAYFQAVESIQPGSSGDPESMAQQAVAGLGKGDTAGFDGMVQQAQAARSRLSAIVPPQPCAAYHRECLESLDAGLELMREMKKALSSPEQESSVLNLADRANALKARSEALQLQEKALKRRYGLMK